MLDWTQVDTVLLDMDGTLLDLHFDNYFWTQHLPRRYADIHGGDAQRIAEQLIARIMAERGTLNWYCLDYWSRELDLDIVALKREVAHLIGLRPSALALLDALANSHCETWLVTNAHRGGLDIKLQHTDLERWLDRIVSSHDLAAPKEDPLFWQRLQDRHPFDPARSVLIDDTESVLDAAAAYGIGQLLSLRQPDSQQPPRQAGRYPSLLHFDEILPITAGASI